MRRIVRGSIAGLAAFSLLAGQTLPLSASAPLSRGDYEACQSKDEAVFRGAIEAITLKALQAGTARLDFPAIVADEWRRAGFDAVLDKRVDDVVAGVTDEQSFIQLWATLADKEKAQELAKTVADRVYTTDPVKAAIVGLAGGVGREVGRSIEEAVVVASDPALKCMQAFIGPRYGSTVARAVTGNAGKEFSIDPAKAGTGVSTGAVLAQSSEGIAGAVVLLVRRQLAGMATRISQRLVGSVLGRLVSLVAGGVGVVLIAKDIWDLRHGALPIIATEMKSKATKEVVQAELAKSMSEQIGEHIKEIAAKTAERVVDIWQEFRRAHLKVLEFAERDGAFKSLLDATRPEDLARLDEVVALVLGEEGDAGVKRRLDDGSLHLAVTALETPGFEIARESRSLRVGLAWAAIAGKHLGRVHELELHRRAKPEDFSRAALARILALGDRQPITRLASLPQAARDVLLDVDDADLAKLARGLLEAELETLARYLTGLEKAASQRVLRAVADSPASMQQLASPRVRDGLIASRDQSAAVAMMLRKGTALDAATIAEDFRLAYDGRVSPLLLLDRHPAGLGVATFAALIVLLMLLRLMRPRRRAAAA